MPATPTRPRLEQIRFTSSKTGTHNIDTYLESAEIGDRTLASLLADLFDENSNGDFRSDIFDFRSNDGLLQFRVGTYTDPEAGWQDVDFRTITGKPAVTFPMATEYPSQSMFLLGSKLFISNTAIQYSTQAAFDAGVTAGDVIEVFDANNLSTAALDQAVLDAQTAQAAAENATTNNQDFIDLVAQLDDIAAIASPAANLTALEALGDSYAANNTSNAITGLNNIGNTATAVTGLTNLKDSATALANLANSAAAIDLLGDTQNIVDAIELLGDNQARVDAIDALGDTTTAAAIDRLNQTDSSSTNSPQDTTADYIDALGTSAMVAKLVALHAIITEINALASRTTAIDDLGDRATKIDDLHAIRADIDAIGGATELNNISTVAGLSSTDLATVASAISPDNDIQTVADNIGDVNTVANAIDTNSVSLATGGSYDSNTGITSFTFTDTSNNFSTTDLRGADGTDGTDGAAATISVGSVSTGSPGSNATVTNTGTSSAATLAFSIPRGNPGVDGNDGADGAAATISVNSTNTGAAGSNASVTNVGTSSAASLDFVIPRGDTGQTGATGPEGPTGPTGATGPAGTISINSTNTGNAGSNASVTNVGSSTAASLDFVIPRGDTGQTGATGATGAAGAAATITVNSTNTGNPGSNASVSNVGTSSAASLDFVIPRGDVGATGSQGPAGNAATITVASTNTIAAGNNASVTNSGTSSAASLVFNIPRGADGVDGQDGSDATVNTANVTAAGALMDTELADLASVKLINQGLATTDSPEFAGLTVNGNLSVSGTTTTVNSTTVNIGDNIITLNSDETGAASQDAGFEIERGTDANVSFLWDETNNRWTLGSEDLVAAKFVGAVEGDVTGNVTGDVTGNVTGNAGTASALAASVNIGGVAFDGSGSINLPGVNTAGTQNTSGSAATLSTSRTLTLSGVTATGAGFDGSADATINVTAVPVSLLTGTISDALLPNSISSDITGTAAAASSLTANHVATAGVSGNGLSGSSNSVGGTFTVNSNATEANQASTLVYRDGSGNFAANQITAASFVGDISGSVTVGASKTLTASSVNIDGGTIDGTTIGGSTRAAISGTTGDFNSTLNVTGNITGGSLNTHSIPTGTGTIALTSDIPTNNNQLTNGAGYITSYSVTQADVTAHQGALSITESQISDLGSYLTAESDTLATVTGRGNSTTNNITAGQITGTRVYAGAYGVARVSLNYNDGGGNANVTFNHDGQVPDYSGNSGRIVVNTDATSGANMKFSLASGVTAGVSTGANVYLTVDEQGIDVVGVIADSISDVRIPKQDTSSTTLTAPGVYYRTATTALSLGSMAAGTVITIYNNSTGSITLNRGSMANLRKAADNAATNNASVTLAQYSTTTVTAYTTTLAVVSGTGL